MWSQCYSYLSLFFLFFNLNLFILIGGQLLYNTALVLPYINKNQPWVYTCSPSWIPPSPSLPIPYLWVIPVHQPQASCILHRIWTDDSYMILYMFQCHSPKSSHPFPLPQSPKVHSTHLRFFCCCLAYRVIIATFLNSIYMC